MRICLLCQFPFWPDDQVIAAANRRRCICIRCFARETGGERPMPVALRRMIDGALADKAFSRDAQIFLDA